MIEFYALSNGTDEATGLFGQIGLQESLKRFQIFENGIYNRRKDFFEHRCICQAALGHPWIMQARKPDAEKHREPTEVNITPEMLKEGGEKWETLDKLRHGKKPGIISEK